MRKLRPAIVTSAEPLARISSFVLFDQVEDVAGIGGRTDRGYGLDARDPGGRQKYGGAAQGVSHENLRSL